MPFGGPWVYAACLLKEKIFNFMMPHRTSTTSVRRLSHGCSCHDLLDLLLTDLVGRNAALWAIPPRRAFPLTLRSSLSRAGAKSASRTRKPNALNAKVPGLALRMPYVRVGGSGREQRDVRLFRSPALGAWGFDEELRGIAVESASLRPISRRLGSGIWREWHGGNMCSFLIKLFKLLWHTVPWWAGATFILVGTN